MILFESTTYPFLTRSCNFRIESPKRNLFWLLHSVTKQSKSILFPVNIITLISIKNRSKKQAKQAAALQCLQSGFLQIKDTTLSQQAMQVKMKENIDFTSDDPTDQDMTHFDESGSENKEERANGQNKRKHEDDNEYVAILHFFFLV